MAKIHSIYPHARLVCCPEKWSYYKELEGISLILIESQKKRPGEMGFQFGSLRSSFITKLQTFQHDMDSPLYVKIWTHNGEHLYMFEVWYDV